MSCPANVKVSISDAYVTFPYQYIPAPPRDAGGAGTITAITVYVPTFEDVVVVNKPLIQNRGYTEVLVQKHTFLDNAVVDQTQIIIYWNVISHIKKLGYGDTFVFSVVLSDNLFTCDNVKVISSTPTSCPLQIQYNPVDITHCTLDGSMPADYNVQQNIKKYNNFTIVFPRETPMGIKILNVKRFMILFGQQARPIKFSINVDHDEKVLIQKELTWENSRRLLRSGHGNKCHMYNVSSEKYLLDTLEILGIDRDSLMSIHGLVEIFNPLVLRYRVVPDVFIHINSLTNSPKHVRLYCEGDSLAITPAGVVPINRPTHNPKSFQFDPIKPPPEQFYMDFGTRDIYVQVPKYNYFL
ncbi:ODV-EC43 [Mocis latipes granulovirus]|uniref:ODV-EC43 n=1 Tax=Mocis latipes granulovirus TaxID=2072024 RepID=A0A161C711_9BBAC|nr:ODV-EC43 [Mocis latipes granulovirus]AKR17422.1 ODV-EC43 [Mocis latipes granulovirus]